MIANNIANANTTRTESGEAYRRRIPVFSEILNDIEAGASGGGTEASFEEGGGGKTELMAPGNGVKATSIYIDPSPFKLIYNPGHPDADKTTGFVKYPNVSAVSEMVDMISAQRGYDASVQIINTAKAMVTKALEIGK